MGKMDALAIYSEKAKEESISQEWHDKDLSKESLKFDTSMLSSHQSGKKRPSKVPDKDKR